MKPTDRLLEAVDLWKFYNRRPILQGASLHLHGGQRIAILGANGTGKTTLLRLLAGATRPDQGAIQRNSAVAYLPQDAPVYRELTCLEHIHWWSRMHNNRMGRQAARGLLVDAGLGKKAHRRANTLSRGQRQRLGIAAALATNAPLLLDEPFASLDEEGAAWLQQRLQEREGILVLHDRQLAGRICHHTLRLQGGALREEAQ